jgi:hypothetical protein
MGRFSAKRASGKCKGDEHAQSQSAQSLTTESKEKPGLTSHPAEYFLIIFLVATWNEEQAQSPSQPPSQPPREPAWLCVGKGRKKCMVGLMVNPANVQFS